MDKSNASKHWVLVDEIVCGEDALLLNSSVSVSTDSDQESDGSISIISDYPTDNNSEEERESVTFQNQVQEIDKSSACNVDNEVEGIDVEVHSAKVNSRPIIIVSNDTDSDDLTESCNLETSRVNDIIEQNSLDKQIQANMTSTAEITSLETSRISDVVEQNSSDKQTQAGMMSSAEITSLESNQISTQTNPNLILEKPSQTTEITKLSNRQLQGNQSSIIGYGLIVSFLVLIFSYFFQQYADYNQAEQQIHRNYKHFQPQNERENAILEFCIDKNKFKGDYFDTAVEKCISKRIRRMEKEDGVKKTQVYLEIKEKLLDLREKELARKEKELANALKESDEKIYKKKNNDPERKSKNKKINKVKDRKEKETRQEKSQKHQTKLKDAHSGNNTISKYKKDKSNETVDGQWYFQLYGNSRLDHRNKRKGSDWYFKRALLRENRRNKAKWYFEYMSNRDESRMFYS